MKIVFGADHGGYRLKSELVVVAQRDGHEVTDIGASSGESTDYPDYAHEVARLLASRAADVGVLVCGSGVGMSIAANRHRGVRAVVCSDVYTAKMSRAHNDANVLCLGERVVGSGLATEIMTTFLREPAEDSERHARRRSKIELP